MLMDVYLYTPHTHTGPYIPTKKHKHAHAVPTHRTHADAHQPSASLVV